MVTVKINKENNKTRYAECAFGVALSFLLKRETNEKR